MVANGRPEGRLVAHAKQEEVLLMRFKPLQTTGLFFPGRVFPTLHQNPVNC